MDLDKELNNAQIKSQNRGTSTLIKIKSNLKANIVTSLIIKCIKKYLKTS